MMSICTTVC